MTSLGWIEQLRQGSPGSDIQSSEQYRCEAEHLADRDEPGLRKWEKLHWKNCDAPKRSRLQTAGTKAGFQMLRSIPPPRIAPMPLLVSTSGTLSRLYPNKV